MTARPGVPHRLDGDRGERHLRRSVERAVAGHSRLPPAALRVPGMSTPTIRRLLNNVCAFPGVRYLEIGCWKGGSLVAAACGNRGRFLGIDNLGFPGASARDVERVLRRFAAPARAEFREADCWTVDPCSLPAVFNVYYYDGGHRYDDHYRALAHFRPALAPRFVFMVDDWNQDGVRRGTRDAMRDLGLVALAEAEFRTPRPHPPDEWWNGFFVALLRQPPGPRRPPRMR